MTRMVLAILLGLVAMAAGPAPVLPVPPIPPADAPTGQLAPVPDMDFRAPQTSASQGVQVSVNDFRVYRPTSGLGYGRGSQFQSSEDKRPIQTPGLTLRLPLQ